MKKYVSSAVLFLSLVSFANAGVVRVAFKGAKAAPKVAVKAAKVAFKVVF